VFTLTNAPPGSRATPTFNVPADVFAVKVALSRDNWPATTASVADILVEYANDVGQPDEWKSIAQLTATGETGVSLPESYGYFKIPDVGSNQRRARGILTNTQTLTTTVSITTYS
jgi:hypothetical protein